MKKISQAVCDPLVSAIVAAFWYKNELRRFLDRSPVGDEHYVRLDWSQTKRQIVSQIVDHLYTKQPSTTEEFLGLITDVSAIPDPLWLRKLDDGERLYPIAQQELAAFRKVIEVLAEQIKEGEAALERRRKARDASLRNQIYRAKVEKLKKDFLAVIALQPAERGFSFERFLRDLFDFYDLNPTGPFRNTGEQIDGAFTLSGTEFLLEAKWEKSPIPTKDLHVFAAKVEQKLENTLGLFISISGFENTAVDAYSSRKSAIILMDGDDLNLVLDERIELTRLLTRKREHASRTGNVYLKAREIVAGTN